MSDRWTPAPGPRRPVANVVRALRRSFQFCGRASRAEFWWYQLFYVAVFLLTGIVDLVLIPEDSAPRASGLDMLLTQLSNYPASSTAEFVLLPAGVSVFWRRLNDIGWPSWWAILLVATTLLNYLIAPLSDTMAGFEAAAASTDASLIESMWRSMLAQYGLPFMTLMLLDLLVAVFWLVAGLRQSVLRNVHGPHPYAPHESEIFR